MNFNAVNKLVKLYGLVGQRSFLLYYSFCKKMQLPLSNKLNNFKYNYIYNNIYISKFS